jgi:hypothetical protein
MVVDDQDTSARLFAVRMGEVSGNTVLFGAKIAVDYSHDHVL